MLQRIEHFEWDDGAVKGQYAAGANSEYITIINRKRPADFREVALPPGVVLAQEVDTPADPVVPSAGLSVWEADEVAWLLNEVLFLLTPGYHKRASDWLCRNYPGGLPEMG